MNENNKTKRIGLSEAEVKNAVILFIGLFSLPLCFGVKDVPILLCHIYSEL